MRRRFQGLFPNQTLVLRHILTSINMTGTSINTPTTVASAAPEESPKSIAEVAIATSKWFDAPIMADDALAASGFASSEYSMEMKLVTVNDTVYGGAGGSYAAFAGGNSSAWQISMHELGHSFSDLYDEYVYPGYDYTYSGGEPIPPNITASASGDKWSQWLGYVDPDHPELGAIGAYEGAGVYYRHGLYRPAQNSKMSSVDRPFDAVSREKIILDIYDHLDPLDGALDNSSVLVNPSSLWVDVIDPNVIQVQWFVDGELVVGASGETFVPDGLGPGDYEIMARAYDDTDWVRRDLDRLEQSITWSVSITSEIPEPGTISMLAAGLAYLLFHRRRLSSRRSRRYFT